MMHGRAAWTVFEFEFRRALTWRRALLTVAIALFPAALIALVEHQGAHLERSSRAEIALFFLIPQVVCLLALLLWATPAIYAEVEAKTWAYLAVRPVGRESILAGKYLAAVAWTIVCAGLSLVLCLAVLYPEVVGLRVGLGFGLLILLASVVYGALYTLFGVLFPQKAMVAAVAYTALMEFVVAWVPATINHFSVQYHLRCLLVKWIIRQPSADGVGFGTVFFSDWPAWQHVVVLLGLAAGLLTAAALVLRRRQLIIAAEV